MKNFTRSLLAASVGLGLAACASPKNQVPEKLDLSKQPYTVQTAEAEGRTVQYRAFEGIVYVGSPVDEKYQRINIYVPEAYYSGGSIDGYTAATAPVFLPNQIGGYMPAEPGRPGLDGRQNNRPNSILTALAKGYVVASPGARGRTSADGKAPAAIVDLKAAVRYLKANDKAMPGDAQKIISNGTSAGGALSALLGASGGSRDYEGRLKAIGAAEADDSIFAVSAYCPITDLEHADMAYEWQFNGVNDYKKMNITMLDYKVERKLVAGKLTAAEISLSDRLKPMYPAYINSLGLKDAQGRPLTLDQDGNGSFKNYVASQIATSAQRAINAGKDIGRRSWLTVKNRQITAIDFEKYAAAAGRQKTPPAFDGVDLGTGENQLFGSSSEDKRHFTEFAYRNSTAKNAGLADAETVRLMNPLNYIGTAGAKTPQHWRIRVGTNDRDTSLAVSAVLALKLQNSGHQVDYALPFDVGHGGDYDLDELFAWMKQAAASKP